MVGTCEVATWFDVEAIAAGVPRNELDEFLAWIPKSLNASIRALFGSRELDLLRFRTWLGLPLFVGVRWLIAVVSLRQIELLWTAICVELAGMICAACTAYL